MCEIENELVPKMFHSKYLHMCVHHYCVFVSGYNNGMTVRNGVHHNPDKLKQLEVERLELGLYYFLQEITLDSLSFSPF